jgi:hypothetical protein
MSQFLTGLYPCSVVPLTHSYNRPLQTRITDVSKESTQVCQLERRPYGPSDEACPLFSSSDVLPR